MLIYGHNALLRVDIAVQQVNGLYVNNDNVAFETTFLQDLQLLVQSPSLIRQLHQLHQR